MDGGTISGWGWADQGWNGLGRPDLFRDFRSHTLRIQQREDGPRFDQVVLSPDTYFTVAPGPQKNDNTKLPANPVVSPPPRTRHRRRLHLVAGGRVDCLRHDDHLDHDVGRRRGRGRAVQAR